MSHVLFFPSSFQIEAQNTTKLKKNVLRHEINTKLFIVHCSHHEQRK